MNKLTHKGYGRIYVEKTADIDRVKEIIREMDQYEYDYLPVDLIAHHSAYPEVVYTHKFDDLDTDKLTARCWAAGIHIWVFDAKRCEYPES